MGKKKFNVRQKNQVEYIVNNVETKKIQIDLENDGEYNKYDKSNALVLPSKKRDTKAKYAEKKVTRILSKKQRKKLEKIVDKKHKKANRSSLLESLASVQLPASDLKQLVSITAVQTKGLKKHFIEQEFGKEFKKRVQDSVDETNAGDNLSSIAGSRKRKRLMEMEADDDDSDDGTKKHKDYNVVGFDQSSDEEDDDNEEDEKDITNVVLSIKGNTKKRDESILESTDKTIIAEDIEMEPRKLEKDHPINVSLQKESCKPAVYVHVERDPKIQAARLKLPILGEEQIIMECINENSIVILAGETGSGKTTQVPQFLYEAGYAEERLIGVTEPRRVAAISMSKRVATEMNLSTNEVSYLIRFEGNTTDRTKIKFMTDGVLLKEIESDFMLTKYSVIILDEAHERSVYTDILIGLLSRIVPLRNKRKNPLKLIIMSATLRISDFTENNKLFKGTPPVLKVDARQYPVTIHFNKRTNSDYVKEAFNKAVKIHTKLPEGGILIFLTGQQEVHHLIKKLRKAFPFKDNQSKTFPSAIENENYVHDDDYSDTEFDLKKAIKKSRSARKKLAAQISLPNVDLDSYKLPGDDTEADLLSNINSDEENNDDDSDLNSENEDTDCIINTQPLWILPLYSLLSSEKQAKVFDPPPPGTRLCVVATNVAETSLTIPNIKYVIDCGRQKTRLYDKITGVSSFVVTFASKASANQRAGRAGRMGPGHCYRLYSSAVFNDEFEEFSIPEIQKKPVDDLMLQMKCMGIDRVINFPFPSPPNLVQLEMAEKRLKMLGALEDDLVDSNGKEIVSKITNLGKAISVFPVAPRFGKMLALSHQHDLLPYTICMVASLSVQEVLQEVNLSEDTEELAGKKSKWHLKRKAWAGHGHSLKLGDPMVLLRAVGASEYAGSMGKLAEFCQENGLRLKAVTEIRKLRVQLTNEINLHMPDLNLCVDPKMEPPTDLHAKYLRQILLAGMGDQVARKIPDDEIRDPQDKIKYKYAYNCPEMEEPIFMHSSSVLKKEQPEFVIYQEAYEIQNGDSRKMFMRGITAVEPTWLVTYVPRMCNFTRIADEKPVYKKEAGVIVCKNKVTFGKSGWELPDAEIEMPLSADACKYFGIFFLNGEVFPSLAKYQPKLLSTPSSMVKIYNKLIPRVEAFTKALIRHQINSREKLLEVWKTNQNYLLTEYKDWLPDNLVPEVSLKWPPLE